jgi:type IV pilus assembly protein PilM
VDSVTIGLDIGSSAVRAAEIGVTGDGRKTLRRYGQIGLPPGYVVDGEVINLSGVAGALRRLWGEGGFSRTEVVLGVSGPRVFVRQADVPALETEDLRSSLRFDAQELVPIGLDDASFDFSQLGPPQTDASGKPIQRILLVAAHKDVLRNYVALLKEAGLTAKVMDAAPLALMRAVPSVAATTSSDRVDVVDVIVSIGAELTTVGVLQGGVPKFLRSLTVGGAKLTEAISNGMHVEMAVAERLKRGSVAPDIPQLSQARRAMSTDMRDLAEDVRATIDFFVSQSDGAEVDRLLVTGGASQTEGLVHSVAGTLPAEVRLLDPLAQLDISKLGYGPEQLNRLRVGAATAIGLALWPTEAPLIRLSVLPDEVLKARKARRLVILAAGALGGVVILLGALSTAETYATHSADRKLHSEQFTVTTLTDDVSHLEAVTAVHAKAQSRAALVQSSLQGDIDWVRVLGQLADVMPSQLSLSTFSGSRSALPGASSFSGSSTATGLGTLNFSVKGTGGLPSVAAWLQALATDPDLTDVTVTGITVTQNGGNVSFSSTAELTPVSYSNRAEGVQP